MRIGLTISLVLHAAAMLWGLISFSAKPLEAKPTESLPIELVSTTEFTQLMAGDEVESRSSRPAIAWRSAAASRESRANGPIWSRDEAKAPIP